MAEPARSQEDVRKKAEIRKTILTKRDGLPEARIREWGVVIGEKALAFVSERHFDAIFTYLDIPNEVPTRDIARRLFQIGRRVVVPRVVSGLPTMTLHEIRDLKRDVRPGLWGIPTPRKDRCPVVDPASVDVALVPCVAVDDAGYRIGHGGGYYDRFLRANPHVYAVGLAFELQRVPTCYPQEWDAPLDALVTESSARVFSERPRPRGKPLS